MSDNRGRGRGRGGRGGQGGEYRGGGYGGGGGERGRGGGEFRGRGGGGEFRGRGGGGEYRGRGGGGEYRGRGGGGEYRGRGGGGEFRGRGGEFRGSRGFRGGHSRQDGFPGPVFLGQGSIPQPDPAVTAIENSWIQQHNSSMGQLTSKMGKLAVSSSTAFFPIRPNFGTKGAEVLLWANYFKLDVNDKLSFFKYTVTVTDERITKAEDDTKAQEKTDPGKTSKGPTKPGKPQTGGVQQGTSKGEASASKDVKGPTGKKLEILIRQALKELSQLNPGVPVATEFKSQVVARGKLKLPADDTFELELTDRARPEKWFARFEKPESMDIGGLMSYLKTFKDPGDERAFSKFLAEIDALGVVLNHTARSDSQNTVAVGRNRFYAVDAGRKESQSLGYNSVLDVVRGYVQSVRPATGRLLLNANVTHGVFRGGESMSLDKVLEQCKLVDINNPEQARQRHPDLVRMHRFLKGARVTYTAPGREPRERSIAGLANIKNGPHLQFTSLNNVRFLLKQPENTNAPPPGNLQYGQMVSVAEYLIAKYNVQIRNGLPGVNIGTANKPEYVAAEWCTLVRKQPTDAKLLPDEQRAMIEYACRKAPDNAISITGRGRTVLALDQNPLLGKFGISVGKELITVKGRELPPPVVMYYNSRTVPLRDGSWNMKDVQVSKPGRAIKTWTYVNLSGRQDLKTQFQSFATFLRSRMGIPVPTQASPENGVSHPNPQSPARAETEVQAAFQKLHALKIRPEFVLVILPDHEGTEVYNAVKKCGDVTFGVHTVCVVYKKFAKENNIAYFANVGLKVNLKLGGTNHKLKDDIPLVKAGKTMIVGYDVTHPTNRRPGAAAPSVAGLVASIDSDLAQWPAVSWTHKARKEMVDEQLIAHFKSRLTLWRNKNQDHLPQNIVIYRDGVSEGQYQQVLEQELPHIREACKQTYTGGFKPRISIIVSVKRHHTRFYPTDPGHITNSKSPKAGTTVDRGVTSVRYWDFFMQAHASLQGTARPAHYVVLLDEIFRSDYGSEAANVLEKLTHDMCYLYNRATKAVSICPPAYYADLVCTRSRVYLSELFDDTSTDSGDSQSKGQPSDSETMEMPVHDNLKNTMYYI